jgi:hypothetical protein
VLKFSEFDKPFKVHTDPSDFAIGGVLMQDERSIAYESKKLDGCQRRWPTHEKRALCHSALLEDVTTLIVFELAL